MASVPGRDRSLRAIEGEMGVLVRRVRRVIRAVAAEVHPELQASAYLLLAYLHERGPVRSTELVETMGIDKGAISRQLQHLSDLGLVARTPDPEDGRATLFSPTDDARRRLAALREQRSARFDRRLGDWTAEELASFADQLSRYNAALDDAEQ